MRDTKLLLFIILSFCFGGSFAAIKFVLVDFSPILGAFLRVFVATSLLAIFYQVSGKTFFVPRHSYLKVWGCGLLLQGIPFILLFSAEQVVSAGVSGIFMGTIPLWTQVFALFLIPGEEPLNFKKILGLLGGCVGISLIFIDKIQLNIDNQQIWGLLAMLITVIVYGIGTAYNRRLMHAKSGINLYGNLFQQHFASMIFLGAGVFLFKGALQVQSVSWQSITAVIYLGLFSNAIAWMIYFYLTKSWGAVRTSSVTYLVPIIALVVDIVIFKRIPTILEVSGVLIIFAGVFLIQSSSPKKVDNKNLEKVTTLEKSEA